MPEKKTNGNTNKAQESVQDTGHGPITVSGPDLGTVRRLAQVSWSMFRTAIPPLVRYLQRRLTSLRLPDNALTRRVIEHTGLVSGAFRTANLPAASTLAASISGRATGRRSLQQFMPDFVWLGQSRSQPLPSQWPGTFDSPGSSDNLPILPIQTSGAGDEGLSIPDSRYGGRYTPAAPVTPSPETTDVSPVAAHPPANVNRHMLKDNNNRLARSGTEQPVSPVTRQPGKTVKSSVVEPGTPAEPSVELHTSDQPEQLDTEIAIEPINQPVADINQAGPEDNPPITSESPTTVPTPPPRVMDTGEYDRADAGVETGSSLPSDRKISLNIVKPLIPAETFTGLLSQRKSLVPEAGRMPEQVMSRTNLRLIMPRRGEPASLARPALPPTTAAPKRPEDTAGPGAARSIPVTPASGEEISPSPEPYGYEFGYLELARDYPSAQTEKSQSPEPVPPATAGAEINPAGISPRDETISSEAGDITPVEYGQTAAPATGIYRKQAVTPGPAQSKPVPRPPGQHLKPALEMPLVPAVTEQTTGVDGAIFTTKWPETARFSPAGQPALERPSSRPLSGLTPAAFSGSPVSETIQTRIHHDSLPALELFRQEATQETSQSEPSVTPPASPANTGELLEEPEAQSPDIDAIARDVYRLLKRRLARERERTLGLS